MAKDQKNSEMPLSKENYILMAIGFVIVIIGFILMAGGKSEDPNVFSEDIFSFRRITLAPLVTLFGLLFEIYAIMKRPAKDKVEE